MIDNEEYLLPGLAQTGADLHPCGGFRGADAGNMKYMIDENLLSGLIEICSNGINHSLSIWMH